MALAGNHGNNVLNDEGMANLKAEMFHLQRTVSNLKNRLATFGVRRHQTVYMPGEKLGWFSLTESLAEFGDAEAYPCVLNDDDEWEEDSSKPLETLYSTVVGVTGSEDDIVLARYIRSERKWEVLTKPSTGGRLVTQWRNPGTKNTALSGGRFSQADNASLYYGLRIGAADNGVTHDPTVTDPITDGNFTCTRDGLYEFTMYWKVNLDVTTFGASTSGNAAWARMILWRKPLAGIFAVIDGAEVWSWVSYAPANTVSGNAHIGGSVTVRENLVEGDVLRLICQSFSAPSTLELGVSESMFSVERLGDAIAEVTIP